MAVLSLEEVLGEGGETPMLRGNPHLHSPEQLDRRDARLGNLRDQVQKQRTSIVSDAQRLMDAFGVR